MRITHASHFHFFVLIITTSQDFFPQVTTEQVNFPHQLHPPALLADFPWQILAAPALLIDVDEASPAEIKETAQIKANFKVRDVDMICFP
jgi:hypothetical protein